MSSEEEMIPLAVASAETGVPVDAMYKAIKANPPRMWAELKPSPRGPVYWTTRSEAQRYKKMYRPHVKK